ncbi:MAG: twin-arginine translocase TatA/TatE family subunit [Bacteroidia bacterium]
MQPGIILFLESLGGGELLVILLFVLLFFGSKNIPSLARGLGKGIREFKDAMNGVQSEIRQGMYEVEKTARLEEEPVKPATKAPEIPEPQSPPVSEVKPAEAPVAAPAISPEERSAAR